MKLKASLPCSQKPETGPRPEPHEPIPHPLSSGLFLSDFLAEILMHFSSPSSETKDGGNIFLRNAGIYLQLQTALQPTAKTLKNYIHVL
jgi:hypothetical protein